MKSDSDKEASTIQSTMIGPLWARAKYSEIYPELLKDDQAIGLMERVKSLHPESEDNLRIMEKIVDELLGLAFIIRARTFDDKIKSFIEQKPKASIINLGCGLDTTFSRVDNGTILWYNLDLPDAIEYRRRLIPETERSKCIAKSIFDYSWMEEVKFDSATGLFMIAGGLFAYFEAIDIANLFSQMASRFSGGEIFFDSSSQRGNWVVNRRFKKYGITGIDHKFDLRKPKEIEGWSNQIQVIDWFPYFSRVEKNPKWSKRTHLTMKINSWFSLAKFIHVKFVNANGQ
ncbi:MAG: class I SAM-dependent methyltransferase [Candidatus Thorarchaeota archaeon]|nr:class I SAM-dependent methyltransferase [Candidatus Thorarchaeota archaeon]